MAREAEGVGAASRGGDGVRDGGPGEDARRGGKQGGEGVAAKIQREEGETGDGETDDGAGEWDGGGERGGERTGLEDYVYALVSWI